MSLSADHLTTDPRPVEVPGWRRFLAYLGFFLLASALVVGGLRLERHDWTIPLSYQGDSLLILPMVQSLQEHDTHWYTERLGFPGRMELYDFPVIDHWHFFWLWVLCQLTGHPVVAFNVYYVLGYPLATLTAMWAGRSLGLRLLPAGVLGLLFSFSVYHQVRGTGHYFLSAYYMIPPVMVWAIERARAVPWSCSVRTLGWRALVALVIASAGAYYAFFSCLVLVTGTFLGCLRRWQPASVLAAGFLTGMMVLGGVLQHVPQYVYQATHGAHTLPTERLSLEAENYALKFAQMVLPWRMHRVTWLRECGRLYDHPLRPLQNENVASPLGALGAAGFLAAFAFVLFPGILRQDGHALRPVALLVVLLFLYGTMGGLGSLFNFFVTPQVRGVGRISLLIHFATLYLVLYGLDQFLGSRQGWLRWLSVPAMFFWGTIGLLDQLDYRWFSTKIITARQTEAVEPWQQDEAFFRELENRYPGAALYTLPYVLFPEAYLPGEFYGNSQSRGILHSRSLRFSYGAMRGRETDQLLRDLAILPYPEQVRQLVLHDFQLIWIDQRGYPEALRPQVRQSYEALLGPAVLTSADQLQVVFDLARVRTTWETDPVNLARARDLARTTPRLTWLRGAYNFEPLGRDYEHIWCQENALACLHNPAATPVKLRLSIVFQMPGPTPIDLKIHSPGLWEETITIHSRSPAHVVELEAPSGRSFVHLQGRPPRGWSPADERRLVYYAAQIRLDRLP